jgi:hypothetical protein
MACFGVSLAQLKNRLLMQALPLPEQDADLQLALDTATDMVTARVDSTAFDAAAPPAAVRQVTLWLAMDIWTWDVLNGVDANGRPLPPDLWTLGMTQALGALLADTTPETGVGLLPTAGVMSRVAPIPSPTGTWDANAPAYTGSPAPRWTTRRIMP